MNIISDNLKSKILMGISPNKGGQNSNETYKNNRSSGIDSNPRPLKYNRNANISFTMYRDKDI
jgi:hypothetical protein